ncbi:MAG TPA: hypothetical protein VEA80_01235 [Vitreimonas sp.]|uniref:hypothetical protein n=1 Tax=Vitreimonas sp. TaxID=3069702 RepID=UPI002D33BBB7|nr:hypothetical protein [Vitreimonas sp.]HYD86074.1 hypothetical protein [Vitreimonas sp.]
MSEASEEYATPPRPLFVDRVHRVPRLWSNAELARVGGLFEGDVVNVSAWRDQDKAGKSYRDYFPRARSYTLTNFRADMRGFQGADGEIFLDLEQPLPEALRARFDVVFNHTTLEHIYDFRTAFENMAAMTRDVLIVVAPWLQPFHSQYGDYWRFSPLAMSRLMIDAGLTPARITWNSDKLASVYVFAVGVRQPEKWRGMFEFDCLPDAERLLHPGKHFAGREALVVPWMDAARGLARRTGLLRSEK